jgi:hypothetical protein
MTKILFLYLFFIFFNINLAFADDFGCSYFYPKLAGLPHNKLTQNNNGFNSLMDGKRTHGCEIIFKSHDSIVSGEKVYNKFQSFINAPDWAIDHKFSADGPGSSSGTIENDKNRCTLLWSQHSWIEESGEHRQSSDIEMIIQCSSK